VSPPINDNPDYYAFMAALYARLNNNMLAIHLYKRLLELNQHNSNWWLGLGISLEKNGQQKQAINAFTKAYVEGNLAPESINFIQKHLQYLREENNEIS
jgi:Flp pilus assembly protein TadD